MNPARIRQPLLMGILNITADSFSDAGDFLDTDAAVARAVQMVEHGADIIDVGGESTRPGAGRVSSEEQLQRVLPVIEAIRRCLPVEVAISIDTTRADVASAALAAGASVLNDVSAGRDDDPRMFRLARDSGVPLVLMHMQGQPATMQVEPVYTDAVAEIKSFLLARAEAAQAEGVSRDRIIIDPGIGFGKTRLHNLQLIAALDEFVATGYAVMLGASRKRFMGAICAVEEYAELTGATCATTALGVTAGVKLFRVHDVKPNRQALDVAWAIHETGAA